VLNSDEIRQQYSHTMNKFAIQNLHHEYIHFHTNSLFKRNFIFWWFHDGTNWS